MELQSIKQRFEIIGNSALLNRALEKAVQVAPTDISVLVTGESGVGKENIPKIIHSQSSRKHNPYIAVNCGAIPEGTIDSELFGHEKGSFTGATSTRKGYFEEAHTGTIFLDEVAELPLATQVRLLRVLETGEFLKVGSSKNQKTDVRIVAATNVDMEDAIRKGQFREDLYYRLNTVEIRLPALRERPDDIHLLFRKFASDFANKYHMPVIQLDDEAVEIINHFRWPGNIRQLKNFTEEISVIETKRQVNEAIIQRYLPESMKSNLPMIYRDARSSESHSDFSSERDILYKVLFDMRSDINDLKKLTLELMKEDQPSSDRFKEDNAKLLAKVYDDFDQDTVLEVPSPRTNPAVIADSQDLYDDDEIIEESLTLQEQEVEMIRRALDRNRGKRKDAASELGISERTLYRKIKQYKL